MQGRQRAPYHSRARQCRVSWCILSAQCCADVAAPAAAPKAIAEAANYAKHLLAGAMSAFVSRQGTLAANLRDCRNCHLAWHMPCLADCHIARPGLRDAAYLSGFQRCYGASAISVYRCDRDQMCGRQGTGTCPAPGDRLKIQRLLYDLHICQSQGRSVSRLGNCHKPLTIL